MSWVAAAMSIRGTGHLKTGLPCQDANDHAVLRNQNWVVGALADGGGSLAHSHIGSSFAARYAVTAAAVLVRSGAFDDADRAARRSRFEIFWRDVVEDIRSQIVHEARRETHDPGQYGTTLIAFVATRDWIAAMQVGDGFLVFSRTPTTAADDRVFDLAFAARPGEHVGEVTWITSLRWADDFRCAVFDGPIDFVCASSDGLEKVAIMQREQRAFPRFFGPLRNQAEAAKGSSDVKGVVESVLTMPELDRFTDDDKTIILGRWSGD